MYVYPLARAQIWGICLDKLHANQGQPRLPSTSCSVTAKNTDKDNLQYALLAVYLQL